MIIATCFSESTQLLHFPPLPMFLHCMHCVLICNLCVYTLGYRQFLCCSVRQMAAYGQLHELRSIVLRKQPANQELTGSSVH